MPKSKKRTKARSSVASGRAISWGASHSGSRRKKEWVITAVVATTIVVGLGGYLTRDVLAKREFASLAALGAAALSGVETEPSDGRRHLDPGERHSYAARYPTSGPHEPVWVRAGFYDEAQPPTRLVHSMEHGNVVIYYDAPGAAALETLRRWSELYTGQWDGLVVTRDSGLGSRIVLSAWTRRLELDRFDPEAAAAFIDAFRGRGPENPVR
ncbi:MAG: DUF3105 domain-containing protein [Alphaproteobacteria bacterium]